MLPKIAVYIDAYHNDAGRSRFRVEKVISPKGFLYLPEGKAYSEQMSVERAEVEAIRAISAAYKKKPFEYSYHLQDFRKPGRMES